MKKYTLDGLTEVLQQAELTYRDVIRIVVTDGFLDRVVGLSCRVNSVKKSGMFLGRPADILETNDIFFFVETEERELTIGEKVWALWNEHVSKLKEGRQ